MFMVTRVRAPKVMAQRIKIIKARITILLKHEVNHGLSIYRYPLGLCFLDETLDCKLCFATTMAGRVKLSEMLFYTSLTNRTKTLFRLV